MVVKPGYKQTDVGVIPKEWEVRPLLTTVRIANGQVNPKTEPYKSMVLVAPDHIESSTGRLLAKQTAAEQRAISGKYVFESGDIVYSKIRPYLRKAILANFPGLCSADMYPLKPAADVSSGFMLAVVLGYRFSKYAESVSVRSGMPKINRTELAEYSLALPPLPEQRAIAEGLSDVDALLGALDRLIAKKRDLKQAAMQQILTGQTRLPGFHDEWEVKRLGDVATIRDGTHQTPNYVASGIPFFSVEHVTSGDFKNTKFISEEEHSFLTRSFKIEKGDILMTRIGSIGDCKLIDWEVEASFYVSLALLKIHAGYSAAYIAHYSNSAAFKKEVELHSLQSAIPKKINLGPISNVRIEMPVLPEQTAIAEVLSDMDAELAALEQRREKTRDLKQAMMQELLTGRTRLI
jgi:type I restriction enzyme, S subunit